MKQPVVVQPVLSDTVRHRLCLVSHVAFQMCLIWQPISASSRSAFPLRDNLSRQQPPPHQNPWKNVRHLKDPVPHDSVEVPSSPVDAGPQTRIVNGRDSPQPHLDFPFFIEWARGCGATLIWADVVLTAAHCWSETMMSYRLRIEGDPYKWWRVTDYIVHPHFNDRSPLYNNNANDFMLLKLEATVPSIRPIPLHSPDAWPLIDQEELTILGYGMTAEGGPVADVLQEANVLYHADCSFAQYQSGKVGEDVMFCAHRQFNATQSIDSCQGDSGGPILRRTPQGWLQVGVTSWGEGCAQPDAPGVYARTDVAYDWIQQQLCLLSEVPPTNCTFPKNGTFVTKEGHSGIGNDVQDSNSEENISAAMLGSNATMYQNIGNMTINTTVTTTRILRVDIHYDNFPQEIIWALAQQQQQSQKDEPILKHASPRQSIAVRNQLVSQHVLDVEPGMYLLEFCDTIAGDGIMLQSEAIDAAIQVWQVTITTTTTTKAFTAQTQTIVGWNDEERAESEGAFNLDEGEYVSAVVTHHVHDNQLLWSHRGDFGEFVRADVEVATP